MKMTDQYIIENAPDDEQPAARIHIACVLPHGDSALAVFVVETPPGVLSLASSVEENGEWRSFMLAEFDPKIPLNAILGAMSVIADGTMICGSDEALASFQEAELS